MAVIDVTKMWSKTGGSISSSTYDPFDQKWAFSEGYQVLSDTIDDDPVVIAAAVGIPRLDDQHRSGLDAYVNSIVPSPLGPNFWMVVVGYEGESPDPGTVEVEWTDVTTTEPIDRDINGRAIVTANLEQVEGLSMDVSDQVVVIRRRFPTINMPGLRMYRRATNSDTYLDWPPGTARLVGFSAKNQFKFGHVREAWDVTARIQFREPLAGTPTEFAWYKRWRHEGLMIREDGLVRRATDDFGQEKTKPVLLKVDGTEETDPDAAYFFYTQVYGSLPYSALGLI
jgi:hypothetical protein